MGKLQKFKTNEDPYSPKFIAKLNALVKTLNSSSNLSLNVSGGGTGSVIKSSNGTALNIRIRSTGNSAKKTIVDSVVDIRYNEAAKQIQVKFQNDPNTWVDKIETTDCK